MAADNTDDFQKELIVLFVQEAHEWLQSIHDALDELQQGPAPERHAKLIRTMSAGVTSLGGSAATIDLPGVAQASFAALPFIEALQDPFPSTTMGAVRRLRQLKPVSRPVCFCKRFRISTINSPPMQGPGTM